MSARLIVADAGPLIALAVGGVLALSVNMLGGLIVRIGSRLYDNSIKSKLQRLQYAMKGAA